MQIESYKHTIRDTTGNYTDFSVHFASNDDPLSWATLGALYSRSTDSIVEALDKVKTAKKRVIEQYYIGYGHQSIGDMVDIKMFIEGIPIWLAFLLERHSLFRGQESSTRYIDFSKATCGYGTDHEWFKERIEQYVTAVEKVTENLFEYHNVTSETEPSTVRAIKARVFDICRGLLPAAASTNVAWFGNINIIRGHLKYLLEKYPYTEVYVNRILDNINDQYPETYLQTDKIRAGIPYPILPSSFAGLQGNLDFGSLRDLNRHRVGYHHFLKLDHYGPMHTWYERMLRFHGVEYTTEEDEKSVYKLLLGYNLNYSYSMPPEQYQYVTRLRSKPSVHPTLRKAVTESIFAEDTTDCGSLGYFDVRGDQTIIHLG